MSKKNKKEETTKQAQAEKMGLKAAPEAPAYGEQDSMEWERAGRDICAVQDAPGKAVVGILGELSGEVITRKVTQYSEGEEVDIIALILYHPANHPKAGEEFGVWLDGGLKGKLKMTGVQKGDLVKIQWKGQIEVDGNRVNDYDIFTAKKSASKASA